MTPDDLPPPRPSSRKDGRKSHLFRHPERQLSLADEKLFDATFLWSMGGRFRFEDHDDDLVDAIMDLRWRAKVLLDSLAAISPDIVDRIVFDISQGVCLDACVRIVNRVALMAVNIGLIARCYHAAYALLTLPEVLQDTGIANVENASDEELYAAVLAEDMIVLPNKFMNAGPPSMTFATIAPRDVNRRWIAHALAGQTLQWVLYHEWWHIVSGHLHYGGQVSGETAFRLHEAGEDPDAIKLECELAQLIEADADRRAAWRMGEEIVDEGLMLSALNTEAWTFEQRLEGWCYMQALLFWWLSNKDCEGADQIVDRPTQHPHPGVRFWTVMSRVQSTLETKQRDGLIEQYYGAVKKSFKILRKLSERAGAKAAAAFSTDQNHIQATVTEANSFNERIPALLLPLLTQWDISQKPAPPK